MRLETGILEMLNPGLTANETGVVDFDSDEHSITIKTLPLNIYPYFHALSEDTMRKVLRGMDVLNRHGCIKYLSAGRPSINPEFYVDLEYNNTVMVSPLFEFVLNTILKLNITRGAIAGHLLGWPDDFDLVENGDRFVAELRMQTKDGEFKTRRVFLSPIYFNTNVGKGSRFLFTIEMK